MSKPVLRTVLLILTVTLMLLPFLNTFQELLTAVFLKTGWFRVIEEYLLPFETRMIVVVLNLLGYRAVASPMTVSIFQNGAWHKILISWNCIGWQSLLLLIMTFGTGLTGQPSFPTKLQVILIGILGTFMINIIRISLVTLSIIFIPQVPATILHNYLSTLITIVWLVCFWWFAYGFVLEEKV